MSTIWVLIAWVMLADGDRKVYELEQFDSEEACIVALVEIDPPSGWFVACQPEQL